MTHDSNTVEKEGDWAGKLPKKDLIPYIVAQVAGGLAAYQLYLRVKM